MLDKHNKNQKGSRNLQCKFYMCKFVIVNFICGY